MTFCSCGLVTHQLLVFCIELLTQFLLLYINRIQIVRLILQTLFIFIFS